MQRFGPTGPSRARDRLVARGKRQKWMKAISFKLSLHDQKPEERMLLGQVAQTEACATLLGRSRTNQIYGHIAFASTGGYSVELRSSVVRVVFFQLVATGAIAALVAVSSSSKGVWFPCALSATVNLVASAHYAFIWRIRAQAMPASHLHVASGRAADGTFVGNTGRDDLEHAKTFAQELAVDGLRRAPPARRASCASPSPSPPARRYTDWGVTLPILVLELYDLADSASGGADHYPIESKYVAAALMPIMVFLGGLHLFFANEVRDGRAGPASVKQHALGWRGFAASCVLFSVVVVSILEPLVLQKCPAGVISTESDGACPIVDDRLKNEKMAVLVFTTSWIGYPLVVLATSAVNSESQKDQRAEPSHKALALGPSGECPKGAPMKTVAHISFFKDACYGALDVLTKSGIAIYTAYRYTWVAE